MISLGTWSEIKSVHIFWIGFLLFFLLCYIEVLDHAGHILTFPHPHIPIDNSTPMLKWGMQITCHNCPEMPIYKQCFTDEWPLSTKCTIIGCQTGSIRLILIHDFYCFYWSCNIIICLAAWSYFLWKGVPWFEFYAFF